MLIPLSKKDQQRSGIYPIGEIYETKNRSLFILRDDNREINPKHVAKLVASYRQGDLITPIRVELVHIYGKLYLKINDGQHTFTCCCVLQDEGEDVAFKFIITNSYKLEDLHRLNITQVPWSLRDYLDSFCKRDYPEYIKFKEFFDSIDADLDTCLYLVGKDNSSAETAMFKAGNFKMGNVELGHYRWSVINELHSLVPHRGKKFAKHSAHKRAICKLTNMVGFSGSQLVRKAEAHRDRYYKCTNVNDYVDMLVSLHNYYVKENGKETKIVL